MGGEIPLWMHLGQPSCAATSVGDDSFAPIQSSSRRIREDFLRGLRGAALIPGKLFIRLWRRHSRGIPGTRVSQWWAPCFR